MKLLLFLLERSWAKLKAGIEADLVSQEKATAAVQEELMRVTI